MYGNAELTPPLLGEGSPGKSRTTPVTVSCPSTLLGNGGCASAHSRQSRQVGNRQGPRRRRSLSEAAPRPAALDWWIRAYSMVGRPALASGTITTVVSVTRYPVR